MSELSTDTVILVFYLNTSDHLLKQVEEIRKSIPPEVATFFIPTDGGTRIECINPKMITEDEYVRVKKVLDECQSNVNGLLLRFAAGEKIQDLFASEFGDEKPEDDNVDDLLGFAELDTLDEESDSY